jgi:hypothetical protein
LSGVMNEKLMSFMVRLAFIFEPVAPSIISIYLKGRLNEMRREGLIDDYKTRTKRLGKFHYKIEIDFNLNSKQVFGFLGELFVEQLSGLRRWLNV